MKLASLDTKLLPEATARSEIEDRETPSRFFFNTVKAIDPQICHFMLHFSHVQQVICYQSEQ